VVLLGCLGLVCRALAANPEAPDAKFRFHGKPVHPLLIKQFEPWISDSRPPITIELNLTASWDSNQYAAGFNTDSNGLSAVGLPEGETYAYKHLGTLRDGTHVLRTFYSGGGSGSFEALLFVRVRTRVAYLADGISQGEQVFVQVVRRYPLGDRDGAEITVEPDRVLVGKSRYREKPVVIEEDHQNSSAPQRTN